MTNRRWRALVPLVAALALVLPPADAAPGPATTLPALTAPAAGGISAYVPKIRHVFVVNIENKGYDTTWGDTSAAPYLAKTLRKKGVLLNYYYGTAHNSQGNYVAQISGQGPNPQMQSDCQTFSTFEQTGTADPGQAVGTGCIFPKGVPSLPVQLGRDHLSWRGYMEGMVRNCQHPKPDTRDDTQHATADHMYATRHNPFAYFDSIIGRPAYCKRHVVKLSALDHDLARVKRTPNLVYITPDLCNEGHDAPCADGRPGGLASVNTWMKRWVPKILASPAFKRNGVLVITADESDGPQSDSTACCGEGPSTNSPLPGINGLGGGLIGALVISRYTKPNTWSTTPYNHYSLLGSIEEIFRLDKLGYARTEDLDTFGLDVYNSGWNG
ncbi:MAG: phosphoesterase [Nocardioides sp.]|nr:phosphoesterase [Nocardioides sp.]